MWSVRNTRIESTRIANVDLINTILSTMPFNRTSNDIDLIQPTQYNVQPNRVAKSPPPEPRPLLDSTTLRISNHDDLIVLILLVGSYRYRVDEFRRVKG